MPYSISQSKIHVTKPLKFQKREVYEMMLTFWSLRVQTERGKTNTATSAQLALREEHSLLSHRGDHPGSCEHKDP